MEDNSASFFFCSYCKVNFLVLFVRFHCVIYIFDLLFLFVIPVFLCHSCESGNLVFISLLSFPALIFTRLNSSKNPVFFITSRFRIFFSLSLKQLYFLIFKVLPYISHYTRHNFYLTNDTKKVKMKTCNNKNKTAINNKNPKQFRLEINKTTFVKYYITI